MLVSGAASVGDPSAAHCITGDMVGPLRSYQAQCVENIRAAFWRRRRVLFVLPTGGGKTVIFAFITSQAAAKGNSIVVPAHRQEIVDQISSALWKMGVAHGRIQPDYPTTHLQVQVAMVQTLTGRLDTTPEPNLLIVDEAHHAVAGTWKKILAEWPNARVLGSPPHLSGSMAVASGTSLRRWCSGPMSPR